MQTKLLRSALLCCLLLAATANLSAQQAQTTDEEMEQDTLPPISMMRSSANMYDSHFSISLPSPEIAELMKYVETPVDLSRGTPNIEIPLYTIECGDLSLPISLQYHAGGIKVDQVASWVGLGWSLKAAGAVTRTQLDSKGSGNAHSLKTKEEMKHHIDYYGFEGSQTLLEYWAERKSIPDLFSYNFMGYSGKFFAYDIGYTELNGSKELNFQHWYPGHSTEVKATDLRGTIYEFSAVETSTTYTFSMSKANVNNVWGHTDPFDRRSPPTYSYMLTDVKDTKGNSITFTYRKEDESYKTMTTGTLSTRSKGSTWGNKQNDFGKGEIAYTLADTYSNTQKLTEIKASNGIRITFTADFSRDDLVKSPTNLTDRPKALTEIKIYDANNKLLKRWVLEHGYLYSPIAHPTDDYNNLRLKLVSLKEYGNDSSTAHIYNFAYYGEQSGEPVLPFRGAFAGRDLLGYCNAKPNLSDAKNINKSFPRATKDAPLVGLYLPDDVVFNDGGNLNPNKDHAHAFSLKSITFPAGGKREYEYEPHTIYQSGKVWPYGGLRIKKITDYFSATDYKIKEYEYEYGYTNHVARMFQKRQRDSFTNILPAGVKVPYATAFPIYDVSSSPRTSLADYTGDGIKYTIVTEKQGSSKTIYKYYGSTDRDDKGESMNAKYYSHRAIFQMDYNAFRKCFTVFNKNYDQEDKNLYFNLIAPDYKQGHLKSKTICAEDNLVIYEKYEYEFEQRGEVPLVECTYGPKEWCSQGYPYYDVTASTYFTGKAILRKKSIAWHKKEWDVDYKEPDMLQEEIYTYNDYDKVASVETRTSKGETILTTTRYASDINSSVYNNMKALRMISYPVEEVKKVNGKAAGGTLMTYKAVNNTYLPGKIYELRATTPLSSFSNFSGSVGSWYGSEMAEIKNYTSKGKIAYIVDSEQMDVVYLWGYNHMYPVAEIKNATYDQVKAVISESTMKAIADKSQPSESDWTAIEKLRTLAPTAQVSIIRYQPLVGAESITGPDLRPIYFDYNNHGQLKEKYYINSGKKEVIERYDYNYKNK